MCKYCQGAKTKKQYSSPQSPERLNFNFPPISKFPARINEVNIFFNMPLLGKKSFKPSPLPKDLKSEEQVFVIKETNEVFRSYEYPFKIIKRKRA